MSRPTTQIKIDLEKRLKELHLEALNDKTNSEARSFFRKQYAEAPQIIKLILDMPWSASEAEGLNRIRQYLSANRNAVNDVHYDVFCRNGVCEILAVTPLHVALRVANTTLVRLLLDSGAEVNANRLGNLPCELPLDFVLSDEFVSGIVSNKNRVECVHLLRDHGARCGDAFKQIDFSEIVNLYHMKNPHFLPYYITALDAVH